MEWVFKILFLVLAGTPIKRPGNILNIYPHDSLAFTQGLCYYEGILYESTGLVGQSSLRKVDIKTGKVRSQYNLPLPFFGEGLTVFKGKIYQLTWTNRICLVYNLESMSLDKSFKQPTDGWGLAHTDSLLIMSNGTNVLFYINPASFEVVDSVLVFDDKGMVKMLNELEVINGVLYANMLGKYAIAKISLQNGKVLEYIDFSQLKKKGQDDMNGISYNPYTNRIYITGKLWNILYEIEM